MINRVTSITISVAVGIFVNIFSDYTQLKGLAVAAIAASSFATASWLRKRPRAAITRYIIRVILCCALVLSVWAAITSAATALTVTIISAIIGAAALIAQTDPIRALALLFRMITGGLTAISLGQGMSALLRNDLRVAALHLVMGCLWLAATIFVGNTWAHIRGPLAWDQPILEYLSIKHVKIILIIAPTVMLMAFQSFMIGSTLLALAITGSAISILVLGIAILAKREGLITAAIIIFGSSVIGSGASSIPEATMFGTMGLILGSTTVAFGIGRAQPRIQAIRKNLVEISQEPEPATASAEPDRGVQRGS